MFIRRSEPPAPILPRASVPDAAEVGDVETLRRLLKAGADANARNHHDEPALHLAAGRGHLGVVQLLLRSGGSVNAVGPPHLRTALHCAAAAGHVNVAKQLLARGANVDASDLEENTPTTIALACHQGDFLTYLLQQNPPSEKELRDLLSNATSTVDLWAIENAVPGTLKSELSAWVMRNAAQKGYMKNMVALLDAGVNINSSNKQGMTAVILASSSGHFHCLKELLQRGANTDLKCSSGKTGLHWASLHGQEIVVRLLLEAGADTTIKDKKGKTAFDDAKSEAIKDIFRNENTR